MEKILYESENILKILGNAKKIDSKYRFSKYCIKAPVEGGVLIWNILTRELIFLENQELNQIENVPELIEKWFLVPNDFDDKKCANKVRFAYSVMKKKCNAITDYTIFSTTDCNARCFYCYELGRSRIPMSEETAIKVADYIIKHCGSEKVKLHWFGGEPLYNKKVIDIICMKLQELEIQFESKMTSNAYLFDSEVIKKSVNIWNLRKVQITLDGTRDVYNKTKAYIDKSINAYEIVLHNIRLLLDAKVKVVIRLNVGEHNAKNLLQLIEELHERFAGDEGIYVYTHVLFEIAGNKENIRTVEARELLYADMKKIREKIVRYGFLQPKKLKNTLPVNQCMADSGNAITILPDGHIGLCEHFSENEFIGHIDSEEFDQAVIKSFKEYCNPCPECEECFYYPECLRLKKCLEESVCFEEVRMLHRDQIIESMKYEYEKYKKGMNTI